MSQEAKVIRVRPGTTVKPTEVTEGTVYTSLHDAVLKEAEIPDGLDPWIEVDGIFFGPDQIRVMKRDLVETQPSANGKQYG